MTGERMETVREARRSLRMPVATVYRGDPTQDERYKQAAAYDWVQAWQRSLEIESGLASRCGAVEDDIASQGTDTCPHCGEAVR